jgi:hypothetical protein
VEAQDLAGAQKECSAERRLIVFIDESGLSERPTRVRTWAPEGCTPVIQFLFNCKHVSAVAGLTRTNVMFRLHDGAIKSAQIVEFLKALRVQLKRKLLIVWDGVAGDHPSGPNATEFLNSGFATLSINSDKC